MSDSPRTDDLPRPAAAQHLRDAALLKATTDLFCQAWENDREAIHRYEELALHLLPRVAAPARAYVADSLAGRTDAPTSVLVVLAKEEPAIAAPILRRSPALRPLDLLSVIAATGPAHHQVIALRENLHRDVLTALRLQGDPETVALLASAAPAPSPAEAMAEAPTADPLPDLALLSLATGETDADAAVVPSDPLLPARAVEGFLGLARPQRLRLMGAVAARHAGTRRSQPARLDLVVRNAYRSAQIVVFARAGNRSGLVDAFADVCGVEATLVALLVDDPSGEPLAILARAAGLSDMDARSVLLLANRAIGESVEAFAHAADLLAGLDATVAETFVAAWRPRATPGEARHVPMFADLTANRSRQPAIEEHAAQPAAQPAAEPLARRA